LQLKPGDKLYHYGYDGLQVFTYLGSDIADGATVPTWICRDPTGRKFRCRVDAFYRTEAEALAPHIQDSLDTLRCLKNDRDALDVTIDELTANIAKWEADYNALLPR
jgi:hypothetical protein